MSYEISTNVAPRPNIKAITPGATELNPTPAALYFGGDGTVTVTNGDDTSQAVPVFAGSYLHVQPRKVTAWTGAAGMVFGLYD